MWSRRANYSGQHCVITLYQERDVWIQEAGLSIIMNIIIIIVILGVEKRFI